MSGRGTGEEVAQSQVSVFRLKQCAAPFLDRSGIQQSHPVYTEARPIWVAVVLWTYRPEYAHGTLKGQQCRQDGEHKTAGATARELLGYARVRPPTRTSVRRALTVWRGRQLEEKASGAEARRRTGCRRCFAHR